MMAKASSTIPYSAEIILSERHGVDYKKALSSQSKARGRSSTNINTEGKGLRIAIKAEDLAALRASINSIMREIRVLDSISKLNLGKARGCKSANGRKMPM